METTTKPKTESTAIEKSEAVTPVIVNDDELTSVEHWRSKVSEETQARADEWRDKVSCARGRYLMTVGAAITDMKPRLKHGSFLPWCEEALGLTDRKAISDLQKAYVVLLEQPEDSPLNDLSARILAILSKGDGETLREIRQRLLDGERITESKVKTLVNPKVQKPSFTKPEVKRKRYPEGADSYTVAMEQLTVLVDTFQENASSWSESQQRHFDHVTSGLMAPEESWEKWNPTPKAEVPDSNALSEFNYTPDHTNFWSSLPKAQQKQYLELVAVGDRMTIPQIAQALDWSA